MALSRAITKSLASSRPLFLQTRLCSHGQMKGDVLASSVSSHLAPAAGRHFQWTDQRPQALLHAPVISGDDVSIPSLPPPQSTRRASPDDWYFESSVATGSGEAAACLIGDVDLHVLEDVNTELLRCFEIPGSRDIATQLLDNIEVRAMLSKSQAAKRAVALPRPKQTSFAKPNMTDRFVTIFGGVDNALAVVCRFARAANEMAASKSHGEGAQVIRIALCDILGNRAMDGFEVDKIVDAVSEAQQNMMDLGGSFTATDAIRFLSFENVWQNLSAEKRQLVARECQSSAATGSGLISGVKAFHEAWQQMTDERQDIARANLSSLARRSLSAVEVR